MPNRLAAEPSPYLRQHADNPVDWYPWGEEAFELAAELDRPILLSVGYSACHWCHVMAHESFEDPDVAERMNAVFVNVKVDREERPDVDAIYMDAVQAISGHGGWPMTVVLTPEGEPFFAGTYFPPEPSRGAPSFSQVIEALEHAWEHDRDGVLNSAGLITNDLRERAKLATQASPIDPSSLEQAAQVLIQNHDPVNGGFSSQPKFPAPLALDLLLRHYAKTGDVEALEVATLTLDRMAAGGLVDHLGGGFARYSVDGHWTVPHFEKMLYDNALLPLPYLNAWRLTGRDDYAQVIDDTLTYVLRDLRLSTNGFASAEDADSEGVEGKFYVWTEEQLETALGDDIDVARDFFEITPEGNFEGKTILRQSAGANLERPVEVSRIRDELLEARSKRVRPGLDDKVLTEWNALMISTLAQAGAAMGRADWLEAASSAMEFLEAKLFVDGRWLRSWQAGAGARHLAYAADYAALVDAFTRLGEATGLRRWHERAVETADQLIGLFWDDADGGLFTVGSDAEPLLVERKDLFDAPAPSANGNAAFALMRVSIIHDRDDLAERALAIMGLVADALGEQPIAFARTTAAVDVATSSDRSEVVVAGDRPDLVELVHRTYLPNAVVLHGEPLDVLLWQGRESGLAYVCHDRTCQLPVSSTAELSAQLEG